LSPGFHPARTFPYQHRRGYAKRQAIIVQVFAVEQCGYARIVAVFAFRTLRFATFRSIARRYARPGQPSPSRLWPGFRFAGHGL